MKTTMSMVKIPAKKVLEPGMRLLDINNIWDYVDLFVEEENTKVKENNFCTLMVYGDGSSRYDDECQDDYDDYDDTQFYDDDLYDYDDYENVRWGGEIYRDDDYRDAFEDEPEAYWGREG